MATAKKPLTFEQMSAQRQVLVRKMLRDEFADFFTEMTTSTGRKWPSISDQELVNAIADALLMMGERRGMSITLLQTMVHELQDRVNDSLN